MNKYHVRIAAKASIQLSQIYEYIAFELLEPSYAAKQVEYLTRKILSLDTTPRRCKPFSDTLYPGQEVRRLLVNNYSIFFFINDSVVTVTDIIYSRSDIINRLKNKS